MKRGVSHTCLPSGTNAQYVLCAAPVRKARPQARSASRTGDHEHRQPSRSFVPTRRSATDLMPGLLGDSVTC